MKNKFNAKKCEYKGIKFDSLKERDYYIQLELQKKATDHKDRVVDIELQPIFDVIVNNKKICKYKADFVVIYADLRIEYIDVKGLKKGSAYQLFKLKKKLVEALYNIEIIEK